METTLDIGKNARAVMLNDTTSTAATDLSALGRVATVSNPVYRLPSVGRRSAGCQSPVARQQLLVHLPSHQRWSASAPSPCLAIAGATSVGRAAPHTSTSSRR